MGRNTVRDQGNEGPDRINPHKGVATREMCMFLILNISSLQLIPVNIIVFRSQYGSVNPTAIVAPPAIVATFFLHDRRNSLCKDHREISEKHLIFRDNLYMMRI